eukprot:s1263_g11.t1
MGRGKNPRVYLDISIGSRTGGRVIIELFPDVTPRAAENFRGLCTGEYGLGRNTKKKLSYEGCQIFRSVKNFMIQTGDFQFNNGDGGESIYGGTFNDEDFVRRHTEAGVVSMANKGRNSNGSQFFITLKRSVQLDNKHIAFGQVVEGMDVIRAVAAVPTDRSLSSRSVQGFKELSSLKLVVDRRGSHELNEMVKACRRLAVLIIQDRDERPRVACTIVGCGEVGSKTQSGVDFHTEMSKQIQNLTEEEAPKANAAQQGKQILAGKPGGAATGNEISGSSLKRKVEEEAFPSETAGLPPPKTEREKKLYELRLRMNQGRVANNKEVIEEQKRDSDPGYSKKVAARKTGRKAADDHWLGLESLALVEVSLYDNGGRQQGRGVIQLQHRGTEVRPGEGQTWLGRFVAIEDGYYEWWVSTTYREQMIPFHFCQRQAQRCPDTTVYREPIHVDVFRLLPGRSYEKLAWLKDAKRTG